MKRFIAFLNRGSELVRQNAWLRLGFYLLVLAALIVTHFYTGGQKVAFVYNEF